MTDRQPQVRIQRALDRDSGVHAADAGVTVNKGVVGPSPDINDSVRDELTLANSFGANVLLIGVSCANRARMEASLMLRDPISRWQPGDQLFLPDPESGGSLVIHEVGLLTHSDQVRLLEWLEHSAGQARVICTSPAPLLSQVRSGRFLDQLFYRLNTVTRVVS